MTKLIGPLCDYWGQGTHASNFTAFFNRFEILSVGFCKETQITCLHVCTVHQQYLNTIYFQLWRTQLKLQNVKTAQNLVIGSDMFRFTMEPSSGSSLYLAKELPLWLHIVVLCSRTTFNVPAVYDPVCGCMVHFVGANSNKVHHTATHRAIYCQNIERSTRTENHNT
jgi:hypothetical protein